jgi:hypothetical protein
MKTKTILSEELIRMKNLFGYERGKVISEQEIIKEENGMTQEDYPFCVRRFGRPGKNLLTGKYSIIGSGDWIGYYFNPNGTYDYKNKQNMGTYDCNSTENDLQIKANPTKHAVVNFDNQKNSPVDKTQQNIKTPQKPIPIPTELKNTEGVKAFQRWLDENRPGWIKGDKLGTEPKRGYGKFGPNTSKAWEQNKNDYLSGERKTPERVADVSSIETIKPEPIKPAELPPPQISAQMKQIAQSLQDTPESFYTKVYNLGLFNSEAGERNKFKYVGPTLDDDKIQLLNTHLASKGYEPLKQKEKSGDNIKIVWVKK